MRVIDEVSQPFRTRVNRYPAVPRGWRGRPTVFEVGGVNRYLADFRSDFYPAAARVGGVNFYPAVPEVGGVTIGGK